MGVGMDGREQKVGGGDVRGKALSWDIECEKCGIYERGFCGAQKKA